MDWAKIPRELRERPQWCIAGPPGMFSEKGKEPLGIRPDNSFYLASVTEPTTWLPFDTAAQVAWSKGLHIGFVLTPEDPFTCIDYDIKDASNAPGREDDWTTRETYEWYLDIISRFDSYTEHSVSGKGFHQWMGANIGRGVRARGIEIYSQHRFIITTGIVIHAKPIAAREFQLLSFIEHIRPNIIEEDALLADAPEEHDDFYILKTAFEAENQAKFLQLWIGDWQNKWVTDTKGNSQLLWPSQSEADLALLSMLTFYSPNNAQVKRLFLESELGKREKAHRKDYTHRTINTIRSREQRERSAVASFAADSEDYTAQYMRDYLIRSAVQQMQGNQTPVEVQPLHVEGLAVPQQPLPSTAAALAVAAPVPLAVLTAGEQGIPWPPGVAGRIAQFIYQSAPRPVKEVAVVAALGLLAGICGKAWHVPQSGLNLYVTLIARSGIGKEAMHSGISALVKAVTSINPIFSNFVNFNDFASGPALTKGCATSPSFVNVSGEWGKKLKRMADAEGGKDPSMGTLRTVMTDLYQKSGPQAIVGGIQYSKADNNIASVSGVAYSMIGETTPNTFYESLTEGMMGDGFLSRFLSIEYTGQRPPANRNQVVVPDRGLIDVLSDLATAANRVALVSQPSMPIGRDEEAAVMMANFEAECDYEINRTENESYRQMWNRAALKALRVSGLLAVADHNLFPCVNAIHTGWAIDVVRRDIAIMARRIEIGDVGVSDNARERKMATIIKRYLETGGPASHAENVELRKANIVSRKYLQIYTRTSTAFTRDRKGTVAALDLTIKSFIDNGYLGEAPKDKVHKNYKFHGKCYFILGLPDYSTEEE